MVSQTAIISVLFFVASCNGRTEVSPGAPVRQALFATCAEYTESSLPGCFESEIALPLRPVLVTASGLSYWPHAVDSLEGCLGAVEAVDSARWTPIGSSDLGTIREHPVIEQALVIVPPGIPGAELIQAIEELRTVEPPFSYALVPFSMEGGESLSALRVNFAADTEQSSSIVRVRLPDDAPALAGSGGEPGLRDKVSREIGMFSRLLLIADAGSTSEEVLCFLVAVARPPIPGDNFPAYKITYDGHWVK